MATAEMDAWVVRVLGVTLPVQHVVAGAPEGSLVEFAKMRLDWEGAKNAVAADLSGLRTKVLGEFGQDPLSAAIDKLDRVLARFNEGLGDTLDAIDAESDPAKRAAAARKAAAIVADYEGYVFDDTLIDLVEVNPFQNVLISARLGDRLAVIGRAVAKIAN